MVKHRLSVMRMISYVLFSTKEDAERFYHQLNEHLGRNSEPPWPHYWNYYGVRGGQLAVLP